jgi:hypothetical protein
MMGSRIGEPAKQYYNIYQKKHPKTLKDLNHEVKTFRKIS